MHSSPGLFPHERGAVPTDFQLDPPGSRSAADSAHSSPGPFPHVRCQISVASKLSTCNPDPTTLHNRSNFCSFHSQGAKWFSAGSAWIRTRPLLIPPSVLAGHWHQLAGAGRDQRRAHAAGQGEEHRADHRLEHGAGCDGRPLPLPGLQEVRHAAHARLRARAQQRGLPTKVVMVPVVTVVCSMFHTDTDLVCVRA